MEYVLYVIISTYAGTGDQSTEIQKKTFDFKTKAKCDQSLKRMIEMSSKTNVEGKLRQEITGFCEKADPAVKAVFLNSPG